MKKAETIEVTESFMRAERMALIFESRHSKSPESFTKKEAEEINYWHLLCNEKLIRTYAGTHMELMSYKNGHVEIDLHLHPAWRIDKFTNPKHSLKLQIESLLSMRYLSRAKTFTVNVHEMPMSDRRLLYYSPRERKYENAGLAIDPLDHLFKRLLPDTKITEWHGTLPRMDGL